MKFKMLPAALAAAAVMTAPAYADSIEIIRNGSNISVSAQIINDRTMVNVSDLGTLGISATSADGVWSFEKDGKKIGYSEKDEQLTDRDGNAVTAAAKPIMTSNEKLVPLRDVANLLDIGVGWDAEARKPVLFDFDGLMADLKAEDEGLYRLLTAKMKNQTAGTNTGNITLSAEIPLFESDDESDTVTVTGSVKLDLKLAVAGSVADGVSESKTTLDSFSFSDGTNELAIADAEIDGIYDSDSETMYLKTDAIEKISEKIGENEHLDALKQTFPASTWYKITMRDYIGFITESFIPGMNSGDLYHMAMQTYGDGICAGDSLQAMLDTPELLNSADGFYVVKATIDSYKSLIKSGAMSFDATADGAYRLNVNYTPDSLFTMTQATYESMNMTMTDEEAAELKATLAGMNLTMTVDISDSCITAMKLNADMDILGIKLKADADMSADTKAETVKAELPGAAVDLMPVLELIFDNAQIQ